MTLEQRPDGASTPATVGEFAARHGIELIRIAYLLCGDRQLAEDLVQEVLYGMFRRYPEQLNLDNPVAYARRALVNANISRVRPRSSGEIPLDVMPDRPSSDADPAERDLLWRAMHELPHKQRAVLVLRFYADLPDEEIATMLDCRRTTVRTLAARGLATLRKSPALTAREEGR